MCTTIFLWNIVGEAADIFLIRIIPLQGYFDANAIFSHGRKVEDIIQMGLAFINIFNKFRQSAFEIKYMLCMNTRVTQHNAYTGIQKRKFTQATCQNVYIKNGLAKGFCTWPETHMRPALVGLADHR